jgi:hypothetical protein
MNITKPGQAYDAESMVTVFLAGSIEMGAAEDWQEVVPKHFEDIQDLMFFNPRRDDWDSSWEQKQHNPQFNYQVNWEMDRLQDSDLIFMYFSPETKSPISLLELGLHANDRKLIVCCPEGFWRKGNVDIVCTRNNIQCFTNLNDAIGALRTRIALELAIRASRDILF